MTSYSSEELLIAKRIYRQTRESKRLLKVTIYSLKSNPRINRTQKYQLKVRRDRKLSSRNYYSLILGRCFRYSIINHQISISKSIKDHHQQMKINSDFRLIIKISCQLPEWDSRYKNCWLNYIPSIRKLPSKLYFHYKLQQESFEINKQRNIANLGCKLENLYSRRLIQKKCWRQKRLTGISSP